MVTPVHINFAGIYQLLSTALVRADAFMGIGLNAAEHQPRISHVLSLDGFQNYQLVKRDLTGAEADHVADEFGKWIRLNGIRELLETFSIFMTHIYEALSVISQIKGTPLQISVDRFERLGIADQVEQLRKTISVSDEHAAILASLNQARNCYAHRRGVVGAKDLNKSTGTFRLSWLALQAELELPDGTIIPEDHIPGIYLPDGGQIRIKIVEGVREFQLGDEIILTKPDLKAICLTINSMGASILKQATEFALAAGAIEAPPPEPIIVPQVPE